MWDEQERDGHCEVGTGQRSNSWKVNFDDDDDYDSDDDDDDDDDNDQIWFVTLREDAVVILEGGAKGNIGVEEKRRGKRLKNRPIR